MSAPKYDTNRAAAVRQILSRGPLGICALASRCGISPSSLSLWLSHMPDVYEDDDGRLRLSGGWA